MMNRFVALVAYHLAKSVYTVSTATSGPEGLAVARRDKPSIVVARPECFPASRDWRSWKNLRADTATSSIAVLMLTARREEERPYQGLSLGADDYLTKPFSPRSLCFRVGAILRRVKAGREKSEDVKQIGPLRIDSTEHRVTVDVVKSS